MKFEQFITHPAWKVYMRDESEEPDGYQTGLEGIRTTGGRYPVRHTITIAAAHAFPYACIIVLVTGSIGLIELAGTLFAGLITTIIVNRPDQYPV